MAWHARLALVILLLAGSQTQAERFPYQAQVVSDAAAVRSGPGDRFYVTGQLVTGETVEVYRHVGEDWCAIRPPSTSFSYVRADAVRATENDSIVEVIAQDAKTRIGSEVSDARNVEYVRLRRGERLQVLGEPLTFGRSPQLWYKIAPPSGEFRFIHRRDIQTSPADRSLEPSAAATVEAGTEEQDAQEAMLTADPPADRPAAPLAAQPASAGQLAAGNPVAGIPPSEASTHDPAASGLPVQSPSTGSPTADLAAMQAGAAPELDRSRVVPASSIATDPASASPDAKSSVPLQKLSSRVGQMVTEPIPHAVVSPSAAASAIGPVDRGTAGAPEQLPSALNAQPTLASPPAAASVTPGGLPNVSPGAAPAHDRRSDAASAWNAAEVDQPAPPSLQVVDQALGQIAALELELSRIVTQDIGNWRLEELQSRITEVYNRTRDPEVQRSLAHIARRTQEFVDLQRRHQSLLANGPAAVPVAVPAPSLDPPSAAALAGMAPRDPLASLSEPLANLGDSFRRATSERLRTATTEKPPQSFAGRGWLVPVLTARPDLPRFALTDSQGRILHFVSPSPGINLRRYMRQEVGIVGPSQPGRSGEASRLVADRVVVLNRQQR